MDSSGTFCRGVAAECGEQLEEAGDNLVANKIQDSSVTQQLEGTEERKFFTGFCFGKNKWEYFSVLFCSFKKTKMNNWPFLQTQLKCVILKVAGQ